MTVKIYALANPINGDIKYVGKTELSLEKRLYNHIWDLKRCKNYHKISWFKQLLDINLLPEIFLIDDVPFNEWKFWEQYWISQFKTWGFKLINITEGGEGFSSHQLKKLWATKKYRDYHTARVQKEKHPNYGKKISDHVKEILRKKCAHHGVNHPNYGKKMSDEYKLLNRSSQPTLKKIHRLDLCGNFLDEWIGIRHMCNVLMLDSGAVVRVLKGKNKSHKSYFFKYV